MPEIHTSVRERVVHHRFHGSLACVEHLCPPAPPKTRIVVTTRLEDPRFTEQMHDTGQLRVAGRQIDPTHFKGVFAADCVPWSKMSTGSEWSVILNTDSS